MGHDSEGLLGDIRSWCAGRSWAARLPLLALFIYWLVRHLGDAEYQSIAKPLNLGIHELGHPLFGLLGEFPGVAGGSLLQCIVPVIGMGMFFRQRDYFAIAAAFAWLGTSLFDVALYAGDARTVSLPLVSPGGGEVIHDWSYLLEHAGMLTWDTTIAFALRAAGTLSFAVAIAGGGWVLWMMVGASTEQKSPGRAAPRLDRQTVSLRQASRGYNPRVKESPHAKEDDEATLPPCHVVSDSSRGARSRRIERDRSDRRSG